MNQIQTNQITQSTAYTPDAPLLFTLDDNQLKSSHNLTHQLEKQTPKVQAYNNILLYILNLFCTIMFFPLHISMIGLVFFSYLNLDIWVYSWSGTLLFMAGYSLILTVGNVPIQIVLLYLRDVMRILCFIFLSISGIMIAMTSVDLMLNWHDEDKKLIS